MSLQDTPTLIIILQTDIVWGLIWHNIYKFDVKCKDVSDIYNNNGVVQYRGGTKIYSCVIVTQYIIIYWYSYIEYNLWVELW